MCLGQGESPGRENVRPRKSESCCPRPVSRRCQPHVHALCPLTIHTGHASASSIHQHDTIQATREDASRAARATLPGPGSVRPPARSGGPPAASSRSVGARMKTSHMMSGPPPHPARHRRRRHSHRRVAPVTHAHVKTLGRYELNRPPQASDRYAAPTRTSSEASRPRPSASVATNTLRASVNWAQESGRG